MSEWLYWILTFAWWIVGAPLMCFGFMWLAYWLAERRKK